MPTPFAALELRVNQSAISMLANASAVINGQAVDGIFENEFVEVQVGIGGVESTTPAFQCLADAVPGIAHGWIVEINGVSYVVRGAQPDGAGWMTLILEVE